MFNLDLSNQARKFVRKTDAKLHARLEALFQKLMETPAHEYDLRKLEGMEERYRIRLSSFRVVYRIYWNEKNIFVIKIDRRDENTYH